ncbi:MAG TPA: hypothetical protein VGF56_01205 [Rhizomicrobium sp.]|jgi:hypothetical protein
MLRLVLLAFLALALTPAEAAMCSHADIAKAARAAKSARASLTAIPLGDDIDAAIAPAARPLIANLKTLLAELATITMRCQTEYLDAPAAQRELAALAEAGEPRQIDRYGQAFSVAVTRMPLGFVTVTTGFNVKCASDEVVQIFADEGGVWRERLRIQNPPYKDAAGASSDVETRISLPDKSGRWFAVTKSVVPWCSSTWSSIRYAVLRPSDDPAHPHVLLSRSDSIWWGGGDMGRLAVDIHGFDLRFHAESIDAGRHNREWVRDFSVEGDSVKRTGLIALSPRDFAEEWIQSKWDEAKGWTASGAPLRPIHDRLHAKPYGDYRSIRACGLGLTQIEIAPDGNDASVYLLVSGGTNFTMMNVSGSSDRRCTGKNLYDPDDPSRP